MEFESLNARDGDKGERRYTELGSPVVPSLVVDERMYPILHPSQIASVLEIPGSELENDSRRFAWDTVSILESWLEELLPSASWDQIVKPTPSRGRTVRNLTVNVFHPLELLPIAWRDYRFDWYPEEDAQGERSITNFAELNDYARKRFNKWQMFIMEVEDEFEAHDPLVTSSRGDAPFSVVLRSQRWHMAFHHRQIVDFLTTEGVDTKGTLDVEGFTDLDLPPEIY